MISPLGAVSPDTAYLLPNLYGLGYGARFAVRQPTTIAPQRAEIRDLVSLSSAAQRIMDQAERLTKMNIGKE